MRKTKMKNYQETYQHKIGSADISLQSAVVGQPTTFRITYKVGEIGIDESGGFKVLSRTASDTADPQITNPNAPNFLQITSSNDRVVFAIDTKSEGTKGKIHERPWSRGISVTISNEYLSEGDEVYIDFQNYRMQTFTDQQHMFKIMIDPFATDRFLDLPQSPQIELIPDKPARLVALVASQGQLNLPCNIFVKTEDIWGNPATLNNGEVKIRVKKNGNTQEQFTHQLENGTLRTSFVPKELGVYQISARFNTLQAYSNRIRVQKKLDCSIYWADLHGQSGETIGTNNVTSYFNFGKNFSFLDVTSIQSNDFQISNNFWNKIQSATKDVNQSGKFIAFPGYEWSGNTNRGGDRNVIYLNEGEGMYRSSHALLNDYSDIDTDAPHAADLYPHLDPQKTIVIPHVGGRYSDLSIHDPSLEPVVEVHSAWGTFEWFYFDALKRGYQVGVVANSDDHTGRLGASYPAYAHFNSYGGLTAILATELTRESIFHAIKNRHCYATTGERISIDLCAQSGGESVGMGDELTSHDGQIELALDVLGTDHIEKVEFFAFDTVIDTYYPERHEQPNALKVLYSGSKVKGRARAFAWNGELKFSESTIENCQPINFYSKKNSIKVNDQSIQVHGMTTGGVQGCITKLDTLRGLMQCTLNNIEFSIDLDSLPQEGITQKMGGLDAKISVLPVNLEEHVTEVNTTQKLYIPKVNNQEKTPVFVKVTQRNGHMAWTSPVFVTIEEN